MKPLTEMTIDEAIELACREVPECWPLSAGEVAGSVWKDGDDFFTLAGSRDEGVEQTMFVEGHVRRALWFDAAWEGLERLQDEKAGASVFFERGRWAVQAWKGKPGLGRTYQMPCRTYDTKYHALAAARLLAAGKAVP